MCLFTQASDKTKEANELRIKAIGQLPEGKVAQVTTVTKAIGSDKPRKTKLNVKSGFKITSDANKKKVKAAKTRRENSLNTPKGKSRILKMVKDSPRNRTLRLEESKKGKTRGEWTGILRFTIA